MRLILLLVVLQSCQNIDFNEEYCPSRFSKDFTKSGFASLKIGMDSSEVLRILGHPLNRIDKATYRHPRLFEAHPKMYFQWEYSSDTSNIWDMDCWYLYAVSLDSFGRVENISRGKIND